MKAAAASLLFLLCAVIPLVPRAAPTGPAQQGGRLVFGISEGTSGGQDAAQILNKFEDLRQVIERASGRKVVLVLARDFDLLESNMKKGSYDFVMARPSDYPARGVREYGYSLVVYAKPNGHCYFIVRKDSPLKDIQDIKGKRIYLPETLAYMYRFCAATARDAGIDLKKEAVQYARDQAAIGWGVENGLVDVGGVASYSGVGRSWEAKGGRILHRSSPRPYSPLIASSTVPPAVVESVRNALLQLDKSESGKAMLKSIGFSAFAAGNRQELIDLLQWLGY